MDSDKIGPEALQAEDPETLAMGEQELPREDLKDASTLGLGKAT